MRSRVLELIEEIWAPLAVSPWGGLPERLRLVPADLVNVLEGRRGRLVSPEFSNPRMVTDSGRDRFRLVVKANAAAIVHRLIEGKLSCAAPADRWPSL